MILDICERVCEREMKALKRGGMFTTLRKRGVGWFIKRAKSSNYFV